MQNVILYVDASQTLGTVKDYANAQSATPPVLVLGAKAALKMRLFAEPDGYDPYPFAELSAITSWEFVLDTDYDSTTNAKIVADNTGITARQVAATANGENRTETEIYIPISSMATVELKTALGSAETLTLNGELCGYDSNGDLAFILQIIGFTVRNRITSPGATTPTTPTYLTATETRALVNGVTATATEAAVSASLAATKNKKISILAADITAGVWSKTKAQLACGDWPLVQLFSPAGLLKNDDPLISIAWLNGTLTIDFSTTTMTDGWLIILGG